ncbi:MAG TPA: hypothetical protein VLJ16_05235, partial [Acidobacteriota bacterium]|nr:hypothetical protein [Acidobacteriota bacterium]
EVHLFDIEPRTQRVTGALGNYQLLGDSFLLTPNEPNAVDINYFLKAELEGKVKVTVASLEGDVLAELEGPGEAGLNAVSWDMRPRRPGTKPAPFQGFGARRLAEPGTYVVTIEAAGKKMAKKAVIRYRQGWTVGPVPVEIK